MTSNVGSQYLRAMSGIGFSASKEEKKIEEEEDYRGKIKSALRDSFRPEFLNRIDEIIIFNPLRHEDIEKIVDLQLAQIEKRLEEKKIKVTIQSAARKYLATEGFDPEFGARPLRRLIQKLILDTLADKIIRGELKDGGKVKVNLKSDSLVFTQ